MHLCMYIHTYRVIVWHGLRLGYSFPIICRRGFKKLWTVTMYNAWKSNVGIPRLYVLVTCPCKMNLNLMSLFK